MRNQFKYSQNSFKRSVLTALGLTAIVTFLVWIFSRLLGLRYADYVTMVSGVIFFSFCSLAMIWRYLRNDIVLAIRPDGLFDVRYSSQAVAWDEIKDIRLSRAENDFELLIYLWPDKASVEYQRAEFTIELSPLDGDVENIVLAIANYKQIHMDDS